MKFIKATSFLTLSLLPFVKCNSKECVTDFEEGKDYFPIKVNPIESEKWSVTYENSYKIVRNLAGSKSYLLYQCGTPVPSNVEGSFDAVVPVVRCLFFFLWTIELCRFAVLPKLKNFFSSKAPWRLWSSFHHLRSVYRATRSSNQYIRLFWPGFLFAFPLSKNID